MNTINNIADDEIDLKELFLTLWNKRIFIFIFTSFITILSIIYTLTKTPIYEARAVLEIASYNGTLLDDTRSLSQELNILYIDLQKSIKNKESEIISIKTLKNQKKFLEIKAISTSNDLAKKEINKVYLFIKNKHTLNLNEVIDNKEFEIKTIDKKINYIKTNKLVSINEKIKYQTNVILNSINNKIILNKFNTIKYNKQLKITNQNLNSIKNSNSTLAAINIMEKRNIEEKINRLELEKINLFSEKDDLLLKVIPSLKRNKSNIIVSVLETLNEEKVMLVNSMKSYNYKNTEIIGNIMVNDYAIKPKKTLIVIISFICGLILSIFLVFFMNFIKCLKKESK